MKSPGKWIVPLAIVAALGTAALSFYTWSTLNASSSKPNPASPTPSTQIVSRVTAWGRLEPEGTVIKVSAPSSLGGSVRVSRLLVKEGSFVRSGQTIAVLDNSARLYAVALQAQAQVKEAQTRVEQVRAGAKGGEIRAAQATVSRLEAELLNARSEYNRYNRLYRAGAISAIDRDRRLLTVQTTAKQVEEARQNVSSVAEVRPTDITQAQAEVEVAKARLESAKADLETSIVKAPIAGQVLKISAYPGEVVGNDGIVELGNTKQMFVVAEVYETDVNRVRLGQKATINSTAFPGDISGTVDYIGLQIRKKDVLNVDPAATTDSRVVEVKIKLDDSSKIAGLTNLQVNVTIEP